MSNPFAHEIAVNGVYFEPLLVVVILSLLATFITTVVLNKLKLSRLILFPNLAFVAILTLYVILIDAFYIKI